MPENKANPKESRAGNSLAVQWLGLCALTAKGPHSIPGQGTRSHKLHGIVKKKDKERKKRKKGEGGRKAELGKKTGQSQE